MWTEGRIIKAISDQVLNRKCVVMVDRCNWTGNECDVLGVTQDLRIIDVEVKISRSDLKADAKKDKWWHRLTYAEAQERGVDFWEYREPVTHPRRVWKHYYALPADIWKPELESCLPSPASGILLLRESRDRSGRVLIDFIRRAIPNRNADRISPEQAIDIARLANLRMWEAYAQRDAAKAHAMGAEAA